MSTDPTYRSFRRQLTEYIACSRFVLQLKQKHNKLCRRTEKLQQHSQFQSTHTLISTSNVQQVSVLTLHACSYGEIASTTGH